MKPTRAACPRLFEVEAARDGRVTGAELARFQAHLAHCAVCAQESHALHALAHSLRGLPAFTTDALHTRRERTRLVATFNAALVPALPEPPERSSKRWLLPLVAAALVTILTLSLWQLRTPEAPVAAVAVARDPISIHASSATRWSRQIESHRENITLMAGTLSIAIDHTLSARRVRVVLPDGELEDLGTTFTVTANARATTHVAVQDGTVILRLRDRAPIVLGANESWSPQGPATAGSGAPALLPTPAAPAPAPAPAPVHAPAPATASAPPAAASDDSAGEFRAALDALNAGNNALAATLFTAFVTRHPSAPNAEDAAYLRVIALQRTGHTAAAASAARDYLRRYPGAFRRTEIEPLAH